MDQENFKDLYTQVTEDYAYIQGIVLKNGNKEEEQLLIITPDYIEKKEEMVFCQADNRNYVIGNRGGCWGLKLQNISKKMLIVRFSKDKEEIANMLLRPGSKYFMNNYNIKGRNYFEIQENESTEKTVQETIEQGTFDTDKNEYELHVFPVERLENHEDYKYSLDDFIKKKERKPLMAMDNQSGDINWQYPDSQTGLGNRNPISQLYIGNQQSQVQQGNANRTRQRRQFGHRQYGKSGGQESGIEQSQDYMIPELDGMIQGGVDDNRQGGSMGKFLEDSKHTMHKMSERKNEERLQTTDIREQLDQCMRLQFVVIIKKTLEVNIIDSQKKLVEMLDSQLQKKWAEQVSDRYVQGECTICYTDQPQKMFAKCGHGCTCKSCYEEFKKQDQRDCPLCRGVIQGVFSF